MVSTQFGSILKLLQPFFDCPLEPDTNNSCLIKLELGISIQLELDRHGLLLMGCRIGTLPMSRYRDNLIKQALRSNELSQPSTGVFGFSQKSNQLILFTKLEPRDLTSQQLQNLLPAFIEKAKKWGDALGNGETPSVDEGGSQSGKAPSGIFGLISK
jgi:hypothetical protein